MAPCNRRTMPASTRMASASTAAMRVTATTRANSAQHRSVADMRSSMRITDIPQLSRLIPGVPGFSQAGNFFRQYSGVMNSLLNVFSDHLFNDFANIPSVHFCNGLELGMDSWIQFGADVQTVETHAGAFKKTPGPEGRGESRPCAKRRSAQARPRENTHKTKTSGRRAQILFRPLQPLSMQRPQAIRDAYVESDMSTLNTVNSGLR